MKKTTLLFLFISTVLYSFGQDISGKWAGILQVQGMKLRIHFNISSSDSAIRATMDSPDQLADGIPASSASFNPPTLIIKVDPMGIVYSGEIKNDSILGTFHQRGKEFPLHLVKTQSEEPTVVRPQEPFGPPDYFTEDVIFPSITAPIQLAGTLTRPKKEGKYPCIVLISGSGHQNRNSAILGHQPFLIIADHLTKNGFSVLRFDDRGTGLSTGNFSGATSMDFAADVQGAVEYLSTRKDINRNQIGLLGHSEGGIIAPIAASRSKDVHFIILLAAPGVSGDQLALKQSATISRSLGMEEAAIDESIALNTQIVQTVLHSTDLPTLKKDLNYILKRNLSANSDTSSGALSQQNGLIENQINRFTDPWMVFLIKYNPAAMLQKIKCPVLALNGSKDVQVNAQQNLPMIRKALIESGNQQVQVKELPGLNHLFQECTTGSLNEYAIIEQTFSPIALAEITSWLVLVTRK